MPAKMFNPKDRRPGREIENHTRFEKDCILGFSLICLMLSIFLFCFSVVSFAIFSHRTPTFGL